MIREILSAIFVFLLLFLFSLKSSAQKTDYFPDRLIIKYESDQELQQIRAKKSMDPKIAVTQLLNKTGAHQSRPLLSAPLRQQLRKHALPSTNEVLRIQEVFFGQKINPVQLAAKINRIPGVAYAEPRYIRHLNYTPNDPELEKFIDTHNFTDAWDLSQGSSDLIIAIVDGGVAYTHPELDENLWVNQAEIPSSIQSQVDQNGDSFITSSEVNQYLQDEGQDHNGDGSITLQDALHNNSPFMNGTDDDNNDFTDDLFGWDFWATGDASSTITADNDPFHDATDHGTHVAGIAAAETDNGIKIASAAFNATYMPIKVGGAPGNPRAIGFGFEGVLYAAENGADIINCSWSGGNSSEAEEEIVNLATEMGALVVAAAGNESSRVAFPARYDKSLAVGSVEPEQNRSSYSNFGYSLDVLATGTDILSTSYDEDYISKSGTSMSTPVISGLAALVKEAHPGWSAERIGMQIRTSATNIDDANDDQLNNYLGHGSANAFKALDTNLPGLKTVSYSFVDSDDGKLGLGDDGSLQLTLTNVGNATSSLEVQFQSLNESDVEIGNSSQQLGTVATGDTVDISFQLTIPNNFNLTEIPTFRLNFSDSNNPDYEDFNMLVYEKLFYDVLAANNVKTSFGAEGTIGFSDPLSAIGGVGFIPRTPDGSGGYSEGDNLLFEGGFMLEIDGELYDAVRSVDGRLSRDFFPEKGFRVQPTSEGNGLMGNTRFAPMGEDSVQKAIVDLQTYAFDDPAISNVVFVKYTIQNPSEHVVMENVYAGIFNDWDIGPTEGTNDVAFSQADSILYLSDTQATGQPLVAVAHMGPISGALAIDNTQDGRVDSVTFGIYDGFEDIEKSNTLKSGTVRTELENTDVSTVVASGPYILNPQATVDVGFIYAFGDDLNELRDQIAEARSRELFSVSPAGRAIADKIPDQTELFQNAPNPFGDNTQIRFNLNQASDITLTIYDVLGRKIQTIVDKELEAGFHFYEFNPEELNLSSGIYFAHLETDNGTRTIGMSFLK